MKLRPLALANRWPSAFVITRSSVISHFCPTTLKTALLGSMCWKKHAQMYTELACLVILILCITTNTSRCTVKHVWPRLGQIISLVGLSSKLEPKFALVISPHRQLTHMCEMSGLISLKAFTFRLYSFQVHIKLHSAWPTCRASFSHSIMLSNDCLLVIS